MQPQTRDPIVVSDISASAPQEHVNPDTLIDAPYLRAVADFADQYGAARFTPGGGVLFDKPLSKAERLSLPAPSHQRPRWLDLPQDRFAAHLARDAAFRAFVDSFTIAHAQAGYRLVVIPLHATLTAAQLRVIADCAETFGHGNLRLTADVSIRLTNVPTALLRPLFEALRLAGLSGAAHLKLAA